MAQGSHEVHNPAPVGTVVRSTCQTWFGCLARNRREDNATAGSGGSESFRNILAIVVVPR